MHRCALPALRCCPLPSSLDARSLLLDQQSTTRCLPTLDCAIQYRQLQAPSKVTSFYNALVCTPPSASVSKDAIGAIEMFFSLLALASTECVGVCAKLRADRVAYYKRLRGGIRFVKELPRSPSGKLLRHQMINSLLSDTKL